MRLFQGFLIVMMGVIGAYTGVVIASHGANLLPVFFGDMARMAWPGQFNLDFMCMLGLSAVWVAWRHRFTPAGLGLALLAFLGGSMFLSVYLLIISLSARGGISEVLIGRRATP